MNWSDERAAFESRLSANFTALPIQFAGVPFTPTSAGWVRLNILPNTSTRIALGPNGTIRIVGMAVLSIYTPGQRGSNGARLIADTLEPIFREAQFSSGASGLILCRQPSIDDRGVTADGAWYQVNLKVDYQRDVSL